MKRYGWMVALGSLIGLAITRQLVGAHGGELDAESTPAEGTLMRIQLPA